MRNHILLIDDDPATREAFERCLAGRPFAAAPTMAEGLARFIAERPRIVLLDVRLPDGNGLSLIEPILGLEPFTCIVVVTGYAEVDLVVRAMRSGAMDFLEKPCRPELILEAVARAEAQIERQSTPPELVGQSSALQAALDRVLRVALTPSLPALVTGESGTGKELAARAIHSLSRRCGHPFIAVNCAALPEALLEAELFGYERGAFTGAVSEGKKGLFEVAEGGTLLLDEVGEARPSLQAALLRVLEQRTVRRVGGVVERPMQARIIAATNRELPAEVAAGRFRQDLYFRLAGAAIHMPPLRDRPEDVRPLAESFLRAACREVGRDVEGFEPAALELLERYRWPGNVRELKHVVLRAALFGRGRLISARDIELEPADAARPQPAPGEAAVRLESLRLEEAERALIQAALDAAGGNRLHAAKLLGIHRSRLYNKLRAHGLDAEERP